MANVTLYTTKYGAELLAKKGWVDTLVSFSVSDSNRNYAISAKQDIIPNLAGLDSLTPKTAAYCSTAKYQGMLTNPSKEEIQNMLQSGVVTFHKTDCKDEFSTPQLTANFHVNRWMNQLKASIIAGYSYDIVAKTKLDLYHNLSFTVNEKNLVTSTNEKVSETTDLKIAYVPASKLDSQIYSSISPLYVQVNGAEKGLVSRIGSERFSSPLRLGFSSTLIGGKQINGSSMIISLQPDFFGYKTDLGFISNMKQVEANPEIYQYIYPALSIANKIFTLKGKVSYNVASGDQIGYFMNFVDDSGKTALAEMVDRLGLYFKSSASLVEGKYVSPLRFSAKLTGNNVNNIEHFGNDLVVNFIYDPNDTMVPTSDGEIISIVE